MPVFRISYKIVHGEKCPDTNEHPDRLFSRIFESINQKDVREIWDGKTEWLIYAEEYANELWKLAEAILGKFDEICDRKCIFDKKADGQNVCNQPDCKFLRLQLCVSLVHHYGFYPNTKADAEIIHWLESHGVTVYRRKIDNNGRTHLTSP